MDSQQFTVSRDFVEWMEAEAKRASIRAGNEPGQSSYNAAWLHGYANAIKDICKRVRSE